MGEVLESLNWQPRQLVGPDTTPALTTLEDNVEDALRNHAHGAVIRMEGDRPVYSAVPLDTNLLPIEDSNNPENLTLAQHVADETIHGSWAQLLPKIRLQQTRIPLNEITDSTPNYEAGNITESSFHATLPFSRIQPQRLAAAINRNINDTFPLVFPGVQQSFEKPFAFGWRPPRYGRVYQRGTSGFDQLPGGGENYVYRDGAAYPTIIAFDYLFFSYRTWYFLYQQQAGARGIPFDRTVIKRYRTQPFPSNYRPPLNSLRILNQFTSGVRHSHAPGSAFGPLYWLEDQGSASTEGVPSYAVDNPVQQVPGLGQYSVDPSNPVRNYVDQETGAHYPMVVPDWSTFEWARPPGGTDFTAPRENVWNKLRQFYYYWLNVGGDIDDSENRGKYGDWFLPLDSLDNFSLRLLHNHRVDNQVDFYPLSMAGFFIILPYGYLPLYFASMPTPTVNRIEYHWATGDLRFAPSGATIEWQSPGGGVDYLLPVKSGSVDWPGEGSRVAETRYFGYPYPYNPGIDVLIVGPDGEV